MIILNLNCEKCVSSKMKKITKASILFSLMTSLLYGSVSVMGTEMGEEKFVGIISAMDNEVALLLEQADIERVDHLGDKDYHVGTLCGKHVIIVRSGIGKVRAAAGVTALINNYDLSEVFFTGIAGGVGDETEVLDVVVATDLVEHDYGEITNDGFVWSDEYGGVHGYFACAPELISLAYDSAIVEVGQDHVFKGTVATGDQFVASEEYVKTLQETYNAMACEMEGAAIAAVCSEYEMPFVVLRVMSDKADGLAHESYENMADIAADQSSRIIIRMLETQAE